MNSEFEALLYYLRQSHSFDFTNYKRSSLMRRVQYRMHNLSIESYSNYTDYIKEHPEEFVPLFNTILINFTGFFRDAEAWKYMSTQIIPQVIAAKSESESIRAWSAACASGEETYTIAMLLAEALGIEQFRERVKVFGTDVDEEALKQARQGNYPSSAIAGIPNKLLEKYFQKNADRYVFHQDLHCSVNFYRHNLIQDAPMSKIDLLVCRNALIYFDLQAQTKVLARFHFSLKDKGFLFLGNVEMLPNQVNFFTLVNMKQRVFTKVPRSNVNQRLLNNAVSRNLPLT